MREQKPIKAPDSRKCLSLQYSYYEEPGSGIMQIKLEKLQVADSEALRQFEMKNRSFFEKTVPGRGDAYYKQEVFEQLHLNLLTEQGTGDAVFYLMKNEEGSIVGRLNLIDMDKTNETGHIGYRVGQNYIGQGIASQAVQLLLEAAPDLNIRQIQAKTTETNLASQKVLEKSGFSQVEEMDEEIDFNGEQVKFVHYIWEG
ncbi:GNAT family N-acetyltransferase [Planococcus glaciei]|uniref:GNAT family N-acetyltransferase n=2 Tax=Planococcus glaciei TaxID=459472 RepID=UPI002E0D6B13